jgi:hypothetical protein
LGSIKIQQDRWDLVAFVLDRFDWGNTKKKTSTTTSMSKVGFIWHGSSLVQKESCGCKGLIQDYQRISFIDYLGKADFENMVQLSGRKISHARSPAMEPRPQSI